MLKFKITLYFLVSIGLLNAQNALHFDGSNDAVNCGMTTSNQISGNAITVEAWIYANTWKSNVWEGNVVCSENNSTNQGFMLRAGNNGSLNFAFGKQGGGSWNEMTSSTGVLSLNTWTHIAGTFDGTYLRIYKNGVIVDSTFGTGPIGASGVNITIGCRPDYVRFFHGKIDEVRIWNIRKKGHEILQDMNGEFCGSTPGLVSYYKFNDGTAGGNNASLTSLQDYSGNNNNGTLLNFALTGQTSNWVSGQTLTIPAGDTTSMADTICKKSKYTIGGVKITEPGLHEVHLQKSNGCDSLIYLTLSEDSIDASASVNSANLKANLSGASYQWLRCGTGYSIIFNETNQAYFPSDNDFYAVEVTGSNGCKDTSECLSIAQFSIDDNRLLKTTYLFPNPAREFVVVYSSPYISGDVSLYDIYGRELRNVQNVRLNNLRISTSELTAGNYFIQIRSGNSIKNLCFIKDQN